MSYKTGKAIERVQQLHMTTYDALWILLKDVSPVTYDTILDKNETLISYVKMKPFLQRGAI